MKGSALLIFFLFATSQPCWAQSWTADANTSVTALDEAGRSDWREYTITFGHGSSQNRQGAGIQISHRDGATDVRGALSLERKVSERLVVISEVSATPGARFLPRWSAASQARVKVAPDSVALLGGQVAHYATGTVVKVMPGIEQYVAHGQAWLTVTTPFIRDENGRVAVGAAGRFDAVVLDRFRAYVGASTAPETINNRTVRTRALYGGVVLQAAQRLNVRLDASREWSALGLSRKTLSLGVGTKF